MALSAFVLLAVFLCETAPSAALEHPSLPKRGKPMTPTVTEVEPRARIRVRLESPAQVQKEDASLENEDEDDEGTCGWPSEEGSIQQGSNASVVDQTDQGEAAALKNTVTTSASAEGFSLSNSSPLGSGISASLASTEHAMEPPAGLDGTKKESSGGDDEETCGALANDSARSAESMKLDHTLNISGISLRPEASSHRKFIAPGGAFDAGVASALTSTTHSGGDGLRDALEIEQSEDKGEVNVMGLLRISGFGIGLLAPVVGIFHQVYASKVSELPL